MIHLKYVILKITSLYLFIGISILSANFLNAQDMTGYQTNGSAINYGNGLIRMTGSGESWVAGTAWNTTQHSLKDTFELTVNMFFGCDNGPDGADGITFQMHTNAAGTSAIGAAGGGMGMVGSNSLAVEFDTWNYSIGGDIAEDHLTIIQDGDPNNSTPYLAGPVAVTSSRDLEDCAQNSNDYYTASYRYIPGPTTQTLEVYEEHALIPSIVYTGDIINDIFDGDTLVWWGFTSSTGGGDNEQWIAPEGVVIPWQCSVNTCCSPFTVNTTGPLTICQGDTVDIAVTGSYEQYSWSTGDSTSVTKITVPGWYTVDVLQNQAGSFCPGSDSIEVVSTGVVGALTGDATICDDGVTTSPLSITYSGGTGPFTLTYSIDGVDQAPIGGINSSPFVFNSSTGPGVYEVVSFEDGVGCSGFISGDVNINVFPGTPVALDTSVCNGNDALLSVINEGGVYDWYSASVGGAILNTGSTYNILAPSSTMTYWVENTAVIDTVEVIASYSDSLAGTGSATRSEGYNPGYDVNTLYFTANRDMVLDSVDTYVRQYGATCAGIDIQITNITTGISTVVNDNSACMGLGVNVYTIPLNYTLVSGNNYVIAFNSNGPHVPVLFNNIVPSYPVTDYSELTFTSSDLGVSSMPGLLRFQVSYPYEGASCTRTPVTATVFDSPLLDPLTDTTTCDGFILPTIAGVNLTGSEAYFSQPNGQGTQYNIGDVIATDQTVYAYDSMSVVPSCASLDSFSITIVSSPDLEIVNDTSSCDTFVLSAISGTNLTGNEGYFSGLNGTGTSFNVGDVVSSSRTIFIYDSLSSAPSCVDEVSFNVSIVTSPDLELIDDTTTCDGFILPTIAGTNLTGSEAYFSQPYGQGTQYTIGDVIAIDQTVYAYDSMLVVPSCASLDSFSITIVSSPDLDVVSDTSSCDAFVLSAISGTNLTGNEGYFSGLNGTGTPFNVGDVVSSSQTVFIYDSLNSAPSCVDEVSFNVSIFITPQLATVLDSSLCGDYILPSISGTNLTGNEAYYSQSLGEGTSFSPGDIISSTSTIYIYDSLTVSPYCSNETDFEITIEGDVSIAAIGSSPSACGDTDGSISISNLENNTLYDVSVNNSTGSSMLSDGVGVIVINGLGAGSYTDIVVAASPFCKDTVDVINLSDPGAPSLVLPNDTSICSGSSYFLEAGNPDGATVSWSNGAVDGSLITLNTTEVLTATATLMGCTSSDDFILTVNELPDATLSGGGSICIGETNFIPVEINVINGALPLSVTLNHSIDGDTNLIVNTSTSSFSVSKIGTYSVVQLTDNNGCIGGGVGLATIDTIPSLSISEIETFCIDNDQAYEVSFNIKGGISPYTIIRKDNSFATSGFEFSSGAIENEGDTYQFVVTGSSGCISSAYTDMATGEIDCTSPKIQLPNSMTPNEDGANDTFWIVNIESYPDNNFKVFNRWGDLVYNADGYLNEWDGKNNGDLLPMGTYFYVLDLKDGSEEYTGFIMLLE